MILIDSGICCVFQGIPSSPVQESNPPVQAPASLPTDAPASLAEGEARNSFRSKNTCSQHLGLSLLCKEIQSSTGGVLIMVDIKTAFKKIFHSFNM